VACDRSRADELRGLLDAPASVEDRIVRALIERRWPDAAELLGVATKLDVDLALRAVLRQRELSRADS
jgi:hypothetical protein